MDISFKADRTGLESTLIKNMILLPGEVLLITAISCLKHSLDPIGLAKHPLPFVLVITLIRLKEPVRIAVQVSGKAVTSSL